MSCGIELKVSANTMEYDLGILVPGHIDLTITNAVEMCNGEHYIGETIVTPKKEHETVLETAGFIVDNDITVKKIPYWETSNVSGGVTAYIANEV